VSAVWRIQLSLASHVVLTGSKISDLHIVRQAYVSIGQQTSATTYVILTGSKISDLHIVRQQSAYVSIRPHTSAYVRIRQHTSAYVSIRQHSHHVSSEPGGEGCPGVRLVGGVATDSPACAHTSAYVSIRQHTSAYVSIWGARV
jgi:hypothetical protein